MLLALFVSFSFSFFNQHQSVPDLTSNPECGLLGSYWFLFVFWNTFCCMVYKENWNLEWLNLVNMTRLERNGFGRADERALSLAYQALPPPACLVDSHCLFCASFFLSGRLGIHTSSTFILFGQLVFRYLDALLKCCSGIILCRSLIPMHMVLPSLSHCLNREFPSSCISYLAPRKEIAPWSKRQYQSV